MRHMKGKRVTRTVITLKNRDREEQVAVWSSRTYKELTGVDKSQPKKEEK